MKILIADDHGMVRKGLRRFLASDYDAESIMEAVDGEEAIKLARDSSPDIILMDITMPKLDGIEATRQIITQNPDARIIMLSMHNKPNLILDSFKAGCMGYVSKTLVLEELVQAIKDVSQGKRYLSSDISDAMRDEVLSARNTL